METGNKRKIGSSLDYYVTIQMLFCIYFDLYSCILDFKALKSDENRFKKIIGKKSWKNVLFVPKKISKKLFF